MSASAAPASSSTLPAQSITLFVVPKNAQSTRAAHKPADHSVDQVLLGSRGSTGFYKVRSGFHKVLRQVVVQRFAPYRWDW